MLRQFELVDNPGTARILRVAVLPRTGNSRELHIVIADARPQNDGPVLMLETSVDGVFSIGDVRSGSIKRIASGVGEGAAVVAQIHGFLSREGQVEPSTAQVV